MGNLVYIKKDKYGWNGNDNREAVQYIVAVDDTEMLATEVLALPGVPQVGYVLAENPYLSIQIGGLTAVREDKKSLLWRVEAVYSANTSSFSNINTNVERLRDFNFSSKTYTRVAKSCYERVFRNPTDDDPTTWKYSTNIADPPKDVPIENTAGFQFGAGSVNEEYSQLIISWTQEEDRNFQYYNVMKYIGAANDQSVTILGMTFDTKQVLIRNIVPVAGYNADGDGIWLCTYTVEIAETDWDLEVLNAGYRAEFNTAADDSSTDSFVTRNIWQKDIYKLKDDTLTDAKIESDDKYQDWRDHLSDPWPLDKSGQLIKPPDSGPIEEPVYLKFRTLKLIDFDSTLDLISDEIVPQDAQTGV